MRQGNIMRGSFILIVLFSTLFNISKAQENSNIKLIQDDRIDELVNKHIEVNRIQQTIPGFRINIFFQSGNNSKANANNIKLQFNEKYPNVEAYVVYEEPHFKVKVGDFRTRMEARGFLQQIKFDFPDAFVIKDMINFPKLNR